MALANYSLAGVAAAEPLLVTTPGPLRLELDDLLYSPVDHQPDAPETVQPHEPFAPPASSQRRSKLRKRAGAAYLPPPNQFTHYPRQDEIPQNPYPPSQLHTQIYQQNPRLDIDNERVQEVGQGFNTGQYIHDPSGDYDYEQRRAEQNSRNVPQHDFRQRPGYLDPSYTTATQAPNLPPSSRRFDGNVNQNGHNYFPTAPTPVSPSENSDRGNVGGNRQNGPSVDRPPGYTKVEQSGPGGKTQLHAVLDYDDDYYDDIPRPGKSFLNLYLILYMRKCIYLYVCLHFFHVIFCTLKILIDFLNYLSVQSWGGSLVRIYIIHKIQFNTFQELSQIYVDRIASESRV